MVTWTAPASRERTAAAAIVSSTPVPLLFLGPVLCGPWTDLHDRRLRLLRFARVRLRPPLLQHRGQRLHAQLGLLQRLVCRWDVRLTAIPSSRRRAGPSFRWASILALAVTCHCAAEPPPRPVEPYP